jgi:signal transduction histidine kinase
MLNLLHGGETPVEEVDVAAVIGEALAMLDTEGDPGGFRIVRDIDPTLPKVRANRLQIEKVLINLLRNALQAMREAGAEEGDIAVTASVKADDPTMALITVRDFGIGLDPQALRTIFQPFRTAKPAGLGLGLAVSRSLVEAAGGKLWAESNDGPGASFHFTLPFVQ